MCGSCRVNHLVKKSAVVLGNRRARLATGDLDAVLRGTVERRSSSVVDAGRVGVAGDDPLTLLDRIDEPVRGRLGRVDALRLLNVEDREVAENKTLLRLALVGVLLMHLPEHD